MFPLRGMAAGLPGRGEPAQIDGKGAAEAGPHESAQWQPSCQEGLRCPEAILAVHGAGTGDPDGSAGDGQHPFATRVGRHSPRLPAASMPKHAVVSKAWWFARAGGHQGTTFAALHLLVISHSLAPLIASDPMLSGRQRHEARYIHEVVAEADRPAAIARRRIQLSANLRSFMATTCLAVNTALSMPAVRAHEVRPRLG